MSDSIEEIFVFILVLDHVIEESTFVNFVFEGFFELFFALLISLNERKMKHSWEEINSLLFLHVPIRYF